MIEQGALVALSLFIVGLVYHAGRMSRSQEEHERRLLVLEELVRDQLAEIKIMLQAAVGGRRRLEREE